MFLGGLTISVELIAIAIGSSFIIWACRNDGVGIVAAKITGYFILILAAVALFCTSFSIIRYSKSMQPMHHQMMMQHMQKMMGRHKMMMQQDTTQHEQKNSNMPMQEHKQ